MGSLSTDAPTGTLAARPDTFAGTYTRATPTDALGPLELVELELYRHETGHVGEEILWTVQRSLSQSDAASDAFASAFPDLTLLNDDYCWRARVRDNLGSWSAWTGKQVFSIAAAAPVLSDPIPAEAAPTLPTMSGYRLSFAYSDAVDSPPSSVTCRLMQGSDLVWFHDGPPREWDGERVGLRYCGRALTEGLAYDWTFTARNAYGATSDAQSGSFTVMDRTIPGTGPVETVTDTWQELWRTNAITRPVGIWYDPGDPDNIRVLDRQNKNLGTLRQSDRTVIQTDSLAAVLSYPAGLSGDPSDSGVFWALDAPWTQGASGHCHAKKIDRSSFAVLLDLDIGTDHFTAIKVSAAALYATDDSTGEIVKFDKATGAALASIPITYAGVLQSHPTGIMVDGTTLAYFFQNDGTTRRFLLADESAPDTITGVKSTEGTFLLGGEMDTTTHTEMYGDQDTDNLTAKFTLTVPQYSDGMPAIRLRAALTSYADA